MRPVRRAIKVYTSTYTVGLSSSSEQDTTITIVKTIGTTANTANTDVTSTITVKVPVYASAYSSISSYSTSSFATSSSSSSSPAASTLPFASLTDVSLGSSSTKLGLAIGIPIAVVSVFALAVILWKFFRKRVNKRSTEFLSYGNFEPDIAPRKKEFWPDTSTIQEPKPGYFNRLSKMINIHEMPGTPNVKSPTFLRIFHLLNTKNELDPEKKLPKLPPLKTYNPSSVSLKDMENVTGAVRNERKPALW